MAKRVVLIDVVGLSPAHFSVKDKIPNLSGLRDRGKLHRIKPVFPAVTLPVQASKTTGAYPEAHGVVSNGFYFPENFQVGFWEQASSLVQHEKVWDTLKRKNPALKTALLFFQNSLYASCDAVITPRPMHTDEGMIPWCYSKPVGLYEQISEKIGEFNLMHYWGPMASIESSRWIAKAAVETMDRLRPDLMFVYLPHLDYCSQRFGPDDPRVLDELSLVDQEVGRIVKGVEDLGLMDETVFLALSEYTFSSVGGDIALNRILREKGLAAVRNIKGREYLDFELSRAFAMVDHQVAHVYIKPGYEKAVKRELEGVDGIDLVIGSEDKAKYRMGHPRAGDLVAVSARDRWFSYYWWTDPAMEPDFAGHIDIHRKPGYDPLELFIEPGTRRISQNTALIRGSHGYPPVDERDMVPLLVSGPGADSLPMAEGSSITAIAQLIEAILI